MKLYNTLTRQIDELRPQNAPAVTVYSCGMTVYDYAHIGHWFTYVRTDILIRTLKIAGLEPDWVMNITDVGHLVSDADEGEDKLEKGARREGKTAWEVAEFYTQDFLAGLRQLNILPPGHLVKATDHIADQIALIQRLEAKGFTYVIDDGVYYDTAQFPTYADFAQLDLDEQQGSGRVAVNPQKRNAADFALWKFSPQDHQRDMEWDSPWGKGFPGWHIECSAMSMKYLGDTLDLHTGGIDHIPVHHTNEIAQSEAATGKRFANHWLHGNHVLVSGDKISKSLGNGVRLQEIMERGISAQAVRLHVLESHYRTQAHFSWENLAAAQNRLKSYEAMADLVWQPRTSGPPGLVKADFEHYRQAITDQLLDDLNTPEVLKSLSALEGDMAQFTIEADQVGYFQELLTFIDQALGLQLTERQDISDEQKQLIAERETARGTRDWATSDRLRDQLLEQSISLRDTEYGALWTRL